MFYKILSGALLVAEYVAVIGACTSKDMTYSVVAGFLGFFAVAAYIIGVYTDETSKSRS